MMRELVMAQVHHLTNHKSIAATVRYTDGEKTPKITTYYETVKFNLHFSARDLRVALEAQGVKSVHLLDCLTGNLPNLST